MVTTILAISIAFVIVAIALLSLAPIVEWRQRYRLAPYGEISFQAPKWLGDVGLAMLCLFAGLALLSVLVLGG